MRMSSTSALLLGIGIGVGFLALRVASADGRNGYLVAGGLTVIECAGVAGLDRFAQKRRSVAAAWRISQAQIVALEHAIAAIDTQIGEWKNTYVRVCEAVRQREIEAFDTERVAEEAAWAIEAEYRRSINANQQLLAGGAAAALPPRILTALGD